MNKNTWKIVIRPMGALAAAAILMASVPSWGLAQVQAAAQAQAEPGYQAAAQAWSPLPRTGRFFEGVDFSQRPYEHFSTSVMDKAMEEMCTLNMGGTAIGTGINADEAYLRRIVPNLAEVSNMEFVQAFDLIDATQNLDPFVAVSGAIKACAVTLSKIANDLRLMSSGPKAGFNEINLPVRQNGSSIMPGKVNPVIPEVVNQVAFNIIGNDLTITMAAEAGQLELNAFEPIIFYCMFQSIDTLAYAVRTFVDNCVSGITANEERCRSLVENSIGIITALSPHVGYEKAADISKKALQTGTPVRSIILQEGLLDETELDHILDPVRMTEPGISGKELLMKNSLDEK